MACSSSWPVSRCSTWRARAAGLALALAASAATAAATTPLPAARIQDLRGGTVRIEELLAGRPTLLLFWNTPCMTCLDKLRAVQRFAAERAERGLGFVMINVDPPRNRGQIAPFLHRHGFAASTHLDPGGEAMHRLGAADAPALFLVSAEGEILHRSLHLGARDLEAMDALLPAAGPDPEASDG